MVRYGVYVNIDLDEGIADSPAAADGIVEKGALALHTQATQGFRGQGSGVGGQGFWFWVSAFGFRVYITPLDRCLSLVSTLSSLLCMRTHSRKPSLASLLFPRSSLLIFFLLSSSRSRERSRTLACAPSHVEIAERVADSSADGPVSQESAQSK